MRLLRVLRRRQTRTGNLYCRKCWGHTVDIRWQTSDAAWGVCRACDAVSGAAPTIAMAAERYRKEGVCTSQTSLSRWLLTCTKEDAVRRRGGAVRPGCFYQGEEAEWADKCKAGLDPVRPK